MSNNKYLKTEIGILVAFTVLTIAVYLLAYGYYTQRELNKSKDELLKTSINAIQEDYRNRIKSDSLKIVKYQNNSDSLAKYVADIDIERTKNKSHAKTELVKITHLTNLQRLHLRDSLARIIR